MVVVMYGRLLLRLSSAIVSFPRKWESSPGVVGRGMSIRVVHFLVMTHLGFTQKSLRKKIAENAKGFYTFLCALCDYFADFA